MRIAVLLAVPTLLACRSIANAQGSDDCSTPEPIAGLGAFPFSTEGSTTDGTAAAICTFFGSAEIYNDVWFCWTADGSGLVSISTCGASFDTKIAVYQGCGPCPLEDAMLACNDDSCSLQSSVSLSVTKGSSYVVRVGAYAASGFGGGDLTVASAFLADVTEPNTGVRYAAVAATTWTAAEDLAVSLDGHLVSIGDAAEQQFVWDTFGNLDGVDRRVWIGFTDQDNEGDFQWTDGTPATFTNWNAGEPNNAGGSEHYTELLGSSGEWNDMPNSGGSFQHIAVFELPADGGSRPSPCVGDLDANVYVDAADLGILLGSWGRCFGACVADLNDDNYVDAADLGILLGAWGACPR